MTVNNKKGAEFAVGTVMMVVLGLVVLIIIILVVRQQVTQGAKGYTDIAEQARLNPSLTKCSSIIPSRGCTDSGTCQKAGGQSLGSTSPQGPPWQDCASTQICCQYP